MWAARTGGAMGTLRTLGWASAAGLALAGLGGCSWAALALGAGMAQPAPREQCLKSVIDEDNCYSKPQKK